MAEQVVGHVSGPYCVRCDRWLTDWLDQCQRDHSEDVRLVHLNVVTEEASHEQ